MQFFVKSVLAHNVVLRFLMLVFAYCFSNQAWSDYEAFDFTGVSSSDAAAVQKIWRARDLLSAEVSVAFEHQYPTHTVQIIRHKLEGKVHYGAIVYPKYLIEKHTPVALMLDGLNQSSPLLNLDQMLHWNKDGPLNDMVVLFPAFRGRVLLFQGKTFFAEGSFSDAYDGATDDAIALLNVAKQIQPLGHYSEVMAVGGSRGGNVALLMGMRDERVHTVIAAAAPVDFYRKDVAERYQIQYEWQFYRGLKETDGRMRAIASSPLHFKALPSLKRVFLLHGENDRIVPKWNAELMTDHLVEQGIRVSTNILPGQNHKSIYIQEEYNRQYVGAVTEFKSFVASKNASINIFDQDAFQDFLPKN